MNANMLFTWRREMRGAAPDDGESAVKFVPATITGGTPATALPTSLEAAGRMEIVLASGDRVIVGADVDAAALTRVVKVLGRR
jgi:transposase